MQGGGGQGNGHREGEASCSMLTHITFDSRCAKSSAPQLICFLSADTSLMP